MKRTKALIIGAGPAGITAAIQLSRLNVGFILLGKSKPGGLIRNANFIENYPGFPMGITGDKFTELLRRQLMMHEIEITKDEVISVDFADDEFIVRSKLQEYRSIYLIVASGTEPVQPDNISISEECKGRIFSDISDFFDTLPDSKIQHEIAVIGSGDAAFDYALNLSRNQMKPTIFMRSKTGKAMTLLQNRVIHQRDRLLRPDETENEHDLQGIYPHSFYGSSVFIKSEHELLSVVMEESSFSGLPRLMLGFRHRGEIRHYRSDYLLFAIGRRQNLGFIGSQMMTKITELEQTGRLFFAGDVKNKNNRQLSIAEGDGMSAALTIYNQLMQHESNKQSIE